MANNRRGKMLIGLMCVFFFCGVTVVFAAVPNKISFQGQLTNTMGEAVPDGTYSMQFFLFDAQTGGNQLWNPNDGESQDVTVTGGIYDVQLGAVQPLDSGIFDAGTAWLEIAIYNVDTTAWETLSPRQLITASAYSLKAGDADTLAGATASEFATDLHDHEGADITGGTIGASFIDEAIARDAELTWGNIGGIPADISDGDDVGITTETDPTVAASVKDGVSWTELTAIPTGFADDIDNVGLTAETDPQIGSNTTGYIPRWNGSALDSGSIFDNGNIGIGTTAPMDRLEVEGGSMTIDGAGNKIAALRFRQEDVLLWTLFTAPWIGDNDLRIRNEGGTGDVMTFLKATGNVGVGTATPAEKLDVNGTVQATGNYKFKIPKTYYHNIHPAEFVGSLRNINIWRVNSQFGNIVYNTGTINSNWVYAGVHLPHGATITSIAARAYDGYIYKHFNYNLYLQRKGFEETEPEDMASIGVTRNALSPTLQYFTRTDNSIDTPVVDNEIYSYIVALEWRCYDEFHRFYGFRITYTLDTLNP